MKFTNFLLSILPLASAAKSINKPRTDYVPQPATSEECCPFTYKATCTKNLERMFHIQLFYNHKKDTTPEQFSAYWANNHTKTAGDFHLRHGIYKYSQYHSTPQYRDLVRVPGAAPVLEFDGAAEFWVQSMETFAAMGADPFYTSVIQADEANFIDMESMRLIVGVDYIVVENQNAVTEHGRSF
ncbi:hypothetical protein FVEN_g6488 [Fusarium venenatum]|uniref:EthD domain-containing protein n=1 Tax=Fusarium venenatum TaxID=56646 RepID=A0A2L2T812_9HYPO|nr:uncharacterized protein FVRRES_04763 [Fusarium venenatum]KAG8355729.1 hypothetical protein FVEN_g6488 [Fusarium venenatum]KAH6991913.1 EthD domain-containing protein [Fusarium venenatum]CEI60327.1 unnamed protein product [Fusarium venenatum]